jgi:RNA polymerase sigma-70 factor (ECF subfamily)
VEENPHLGKPGNPCNGGGGPTSRAYAQAHLGRETTIPTSEFDRRLRAAKDGDETSFSQLFRSVQPRLLRYLRTIGGGLAEDVAADTWLSVVRGLRRFTGDEAKWEAWVFTIARARMVDAQRKAGRTPVPVDTDAVLEGKASTADVVEAVEEVFSTEAALSLIGRLPQLQAEAVMLRHVVGLDVAHTAQILGKQPGAVRVCAHRGLRRLAEMLSDRDVLSAASARSNAPDSVFG